MIISGIPSPLSLFWRLGLLLLLLKDYFYEITNKRLFEKRGLVNEI